MNVFGEIKSRISMSDVCSMLNLSVNRRGFILCPFHNEKSPSCKVYDNSYFCFSCGAGGDIINFVAEYKGVSPLEAAQEIDGYFSLGLMSRENKPTPRKSRTPKPVSFEQFNSIYRMVTLDILAEICRKVWHVEGDSENYRQAERIHQELLESDSTTVREFKKQFGKEVAKIVNQYRM